MTPAPRQPPGRRSKSHEQAQRFLSVHGIIQNLFRVGRHLVSAANHRMLRERSFLVWLPAKTEEEAHALVQKVLAWEDTAQSLSGKAILVADNPDEAGDFKADITDVQASLLGDRETQSILLREHGGNSWRRS